MRKLVATAAVAGLVALTAACDTVDNTTYTKVGTTGIVATPDLQFFKDAGAPLIHLYVLCNFGGTLQYRNSPEVSAYSMSQGQTLNVYCSNYTVNGIRGVRSTDWHVTGRQS